MNTRTIHSDGITHTLATACADSLKELAEQATPDAILGAVAHLPEEEANAALYGALNALEELKNLSSSASPETKGDEE